MVNIKKLRKKIRCLNCKQEFEVHPCRNDTAFFCSKKCINIGRKKSLEKIQQELKNRLQQRKKTQKEESFMELLNILNLDYSFVGDGKFCPDFLHNN